jgi:predicted esterase
MQAYVDERAALLGVPVVLLARPGTYGSSGDHRQRRREPESRLVSTALDELKRRLGLHTLALAGFSGGGHVVAALLGWRSDVPCAALGSAVSSPRLRWQALGLTRDMTGFTDSYEPAQHLGSARLAGARVYIVGDPRDRNTPWSTQLPFGERLRERGAEVRVVETEGHGPEHHDVSAEAQRLAAACLRERLEAAGPVGAPPPR